MAARDSALRSRFMRWCGPGPLRTRLQRSAGRGLTKFVGREREMDAMKAAAELTKAVGQIVAAMAEPGVGKSRLFSSSRRPRSPAGWCWRPIRCRTARPAHTYRVIDLLHRYFKSLPVRTATRITARKESPGGYVRSPSIARWRMTLPHTLFALLGSCRGRRPARRGWTGKHAGGGGRWMRSSGFCCANRLNQPLTVIFEDLHWIDEETQALLNLVVE